jgi:methionyl-tRNA formyltransferase
VSRIAFLGSPEAALPTLTALADSHDIPLVITRPDRPRGRGREPKPTPVKIEAERIGLDVAVPESPEELGAMLSAAGPLDLAVVVAYGRLLRATALEIPARGMLNLHFSLLPRWRGAAPVSRALMAGDLMTGVTIFRLDEGLDTGPVLTAQAIDIEPEETAGALTSRLATIGARLMTAVVPGYLTGKIDPVPQSDEGMTQAGKIEPEERVIRVSGHLQDEVNRVRALSPTPGATLVIDGDVHQILQARRADLAPDPGTWVQLSGRPVAGLADGGMEMVSILPPGKRPMDGGAWLRGLRRESGAVG